MIFVKSCVFWGKSRKVVIMPYCFLNNFWSTYDIFMKFLENGHNIISYQYKKYRHSKITESQIRGGVKGWNWPLEISKIIKLTDRKAYFWTEFSQEKVFLRYKHLLNITIKFHEKFQVISDTIYWLWKENGWFSSNRAFFGKNTEKC